MTELGRAGAALDAEIDAFEEKTKLLVKERTDAAMTADRAVARLADHLMSRERVLAKVQEEYEAAIEAELEAD